MHRLLSVALAVVIAVVIGHLLAPHLMSVALSGLSSLHRPLLPGGAGGALGP